MFDSEEGSSRTGCEARDAECTLSFFDAQYAGYQVWGILKRPGLSGDIMSRFRPVPKRTTTRRSSFRGRWNDKWFDASKGYGFIVPDNGLPDILLHVTCLRAGGFPDSLRGRARSLRSVCAGRKGMQAFRILSMDESTAIHPSQLPQRTHVIVQPESDWERAYVKWFNRVRGFGFLTRGEGTPDIFCHMETLRRFGFTELRPGQIVQVRWGYGSKGCMAAELRPDGVPNGLPSRN